MAAALQGGSNMKLNRRLVMALLGPRSENALGPSTSGKAHYFPDSAGDDGAHNEGTRRHRAPAGRSGHAAFIGYFVLPAWLAGGFLDYIWHRRTKKSLKQSPMMVEGGPAVFGAPFLEVNAGVIAMIVSTAMVHEATAIWDVFYIYTAPRRTILPAEQHIHSFLEMVPFCVASAAVCVTATRHSRWWDQCVRAILRIARGSYLRE
jgi:hypothetical protein